MSKCWKCNKEFYSENLIRTLCDECLEKIPKTTATTDFGNLLNSEIKDLVDDFSKRKISELEAKLAEKDAEIKQLNNRILFSQLQAPKEQILNILGSQCIQYNSKQDKISFALEQLEKVKGILIQNADEIGEEYKEDYFMISLGNVKNIIDQQINKLKGKVEDVKD